MIESRADLLDRIEVAEETAAAARAERDAAVEALVDVLVVLAAWGANLDEGAPGAVCEVALRDAVADGARAARARGGLRALGVA